MELTEEFYPIKGFEGYYEITKTGIIRSLDRLVPGRGGVGWSPIKGKIIKPHITNKGYYRFNLYKLNHNRRYSMHRLLAINFIPNPQNLPQINHINGVRLDNGLDNLEWCDSSHNNKDTYNRGFINKSRKLSDEDVEYIYMNGIIASGKSKQDGNIPELAAKFNMDLSPIRMIVKGISYKNITNKLKRQQDGF